VRFDNTLRTRTQELAWRMHGLYLARHTPPAVYAKKCNNCSLYHRCLPRATSRQTTLERYLAKALCDEMTES
jgi:CRISPR-associated exonuclease Cas4